MHFQKTNVAGYMHSRFSAAFSRQLMESTIPHRKVGDYALSKNKRGRKHAQQLFCCVFSAVTENPIPHLSVGDIFTSHGPVFRRYVPVAILGAASDEGYRESFFQ